MIAHKILRFLPVLVLIAAIGAGTGGCALLSGGFANTGSFTVVATPDSGHPPFTAVLTATPFQKDGEMYGTYVWELPTGNIFTAGRNTISVTIDEPGWEAVCYWQDGNTITKRITVRPGTSNSAPAIFHPKKVGAGADKFLRPGEETLLYWPINQELGTCAPSERRGIFDPEGDEVTILCIKVRLLSKGVDDTIFTPPYRVARDGGTVYHAKGTNTQLMENAFLFYPGYTATEYDYRNRP